jgi:hypothetical protein
VKRIISSQDLYEVLLLTLGWPCCSFAHLALVPFLSEKAVVGGMVCPQFLSRLKTNTVVQPRQTELI